MTAAERLQTNPVSDPCLARVMGGGATRRSSTCLAMIVGMTSRPTKRSVFASSLFCPARSRGSEPAMGACAAATAHPDRKLADAHDGTSLDVRKPPGPD